MRDDITVKDVARKIAPSANGQSIGRLVEQVRYWTRLDLLEVVGAKHAGTGRWRIYPETEVLIASVLAELSEYHVGIELMRGVTNDLRKNLTQRNRKNWVHNQVQAALVGDRTIYMVLSFPETRAITVVTYGSNLSDIFSDRDEPASSITLNITKIFSRVR